MGISKYRNLPMLVDPATIAKAVDDLLAEARADPRIPPAEVADALREMVNRQSDTLVPFDDETARRIEDWVVSVWSEDSVEFFDLLCFLVANTNRGRGRILLEDSLRSQNPHIRAIAQETLDEL